MNRCSLLHTHAPILLMIVLHVNYASYLKTFPYTFSQFEQQLSTKVFELSCEYTFTSKSGNFCRKKLQNCIINVYSSVRFKENIQIQSELRFRGYSNSMNTLNIFRRRPCYASMNVTKYKSTHSNVTIV